MHVYILVRARYAARMNPDLPLARRDELASRLSSGQSLVAANLAVEFAVSEDAIRRDLRALASEGKCRRVYGGALPVLPAALPMAARIDMDADRKRILAQTAASLIQPGQFLFLDSGSTNLALANILPADFELTVVTNSVDIAAAVLRRTDLQLVMTGGLVDQHVGGSVDPTSVEFVRRMSFDMCFIGACAVSTSRGIGAFGLSDAAFKRAVVAASAQKVVLATTAKLHARAPYSVANMKEIDFLIVEEDAPGDVLAALSKSGPTVMTAVEKS
ncbi:DeoR/GlpR family DNA-binding transcription regulator [Caballeronia sp. LP006]|uniref:DeoR/GlpR family DNA-binding transcription regulator n=1 Tax=unclassified Caballeronia TaxID=2646786 RepID=UPI00202820D0|nr:MULTISPECIES: DeoR/GlpR family DNA-binding transcription regulator [unclassified Caballeronia]MDR5827711.1 DeoR/GlpR family DNA-binding transcription regulator [Caballeronia sp. LP006]